MKEFERAKRLNLNLNKHFKRNKSSWWVSPSPYVKNTLILHLYKRTPIKQRWVAKYIFKTEKSISIIWGNGAVFTRKAMGL